LKKEKSSRIKQGGNVVDIIDEAQAEQLNAVWSEIDGVK